MTGRSAACCEKLGLKKGPWTPEEDQKLLAYIEEHGHGSWRSLPSKAGLQRCGKSCRLRWTNYLRPDIKRGKFSLQEEQSIIQLHALLGNRWSAIATHLPKRTDNEIKNYWNTHLKKRLAKLGIDPVTHKPKNATLSSIDGPSKNESNLSHMAQWESARLEAEARLVRDSKLRSHSSFKLQLTQLGSSSSAACQAGPNWHGTMWSSKSNKVSAGLDDSPTSTMTFSEQNLSLPAALAVGLSDHDTALNNEFVGAGSSNSHERSVVLAVKEERNEEELKSIGKSSHFLNIPDIVLFPNAYHHEGTQWKYGHASKSAGDVGNDAPMVDDDNVNLPAAGNNNFINGFTELLINHDRPNITSSSSDNGECTDDNGYEQEVSKDYWNNILDLVNSSPSDAPPVF
ncbi:hypothetical protein C5167_043510 [Papaver somniferum]|uniref:Uncharacterized protein n=1 Tax=Papaver somniferum TaxID=3469 RepID=A0A4Y7L5X6_PAPSO|nr:transcription factor MYB16-like [Papaver somniferum]RZC80943.1 hypothetical protein C5167_043510 [Papaver somniferum]